MSILVFLLVAVVVVVVVVVLLLLLLLLHAVIGICHGLFNDACISFMETVLDVYVIQ
jgi:hypothetical protein